MLNSSRTRVLAMVAGAAILAACEESVTDPTPVFRLPAEYAFVTTTDFSTGTGAVVSADSLLRPYCNLQGTHSDAVARYFDGRIFVVNRAGADNIQVLDPYVAFATIKQFSVGNGSDPHDIAFVSRSRAFVTRYNENQLWIVNTNSGQKAGQIDFSWLADADLIPEMDHMIRVGDRIFVSVERLDRNAALWPPVGDSYIAVFDAYTEQFIDANPSQGGIQALKLVATNPFGEMVLNPAAAVIWVPMAGRFGFLDGGLEAVNPATLESELVLTESQLGGDITDVVPIDENRGVAIISDAGFNNLLVGFDLSTPGSIDTLYAPGGFVLQDAELSRDGRIFLSDRTTANPGLRVFDGTTWTQMTTSPVDVCLPPADIVFGKR